ncbi:MAG TPA: prepilin-type N-terminal cleavage/methylation domain-containing protein [Acetivibrio sp.]|nr:prepilin-type N-terminal cleavage/methylation domain-containing protein [Acetivibrio sp.]
MNRKGVTLIELIISISIVMIVAAPFLGTFLSAVKNNTASKEIMESSTLALRVMEEIKSRPLFLSSEAVTQTQSPLTQYREYLNEEEYVVKYKIVKEEGEVSSLSETYEFEKTEDTVFNIEFSIDSGTVILNGQSYQKYADGLPVLFSLEISEESGVYSYSFYDEDNDGLQSSVLGTVPLTEPLKIKINCLNESSETFYMNVNLDGIEEDRDVYFYVFNDRNNAVYLSNSGTKPFYRLLRIDGEQVGYFNSLYKIEVVIEKEDKIVNRLVSYVKK